MEIAITGWSLALDGVSSAADLRLALDQCRPGSFGPGGSGRRRDGPRGPESALETAVAGFPAKLRNQCDPSTLLGMRCLSELYEHRRLKDLLPSDRVGVFCTTTLGGVEFSEPQLFAQTFTGPHRVSAYQAIAWFYAAAQGQWTIAEGVRGHAKSFVGDRVGAIQAMLGAAMALEAGHCDAALCAAFEAPLSPFSLALLQSGGRIPAGGGSWLSEGAAGLCLETPQRALERDGQILGFIAGIDTRPSGDDVGHALGRCIAAVLEEARSNDVVITSAMIGAVPPGLPALAGPEVAVPAFDRSSTVAAFGDLLSVGCFLDLVCGCLGLASGGDRRSGQNAKEGFLLVAADAAAVGCAAVRPALDGGRC